VFVDADGIWLNAAKTNRYYKRTSQHETNEAASMDKVLHALGVKVETVVDLGANFGEVSLWFARHYPRARVIAVEPSPENLDVLYRNIAINDARCEVIPVAIADYDGEVKMTAGRASENTIVGGTNPVPCLTLERIVEQAKLARINFLKVDIEGAEPLLTASLKALHDCIDAMLIEVGLKGDLDGYAVLLTMLEQHRFALHLHPQFALNAAPQLVPITANAIVSRAAELRKTGVSFDCWAIRRP
jgi:FkbM family methyltransferase